MKHQILIVDDSEMNREILTNMLENQFDIYQVENGQQALDALASGKYIFRLILLDLQMPVLDGYGVLREMKKKGWIDEIPVMIISADNSSEALHTAYELGAVDFFLKPFDLQIVLHRVNNIVRLHEKDYQDVLTGCYNRKGFIQVAQNYLDFVGNPEDCAIAYFDINNFNAVNELFGVEGGDDVLKSYCDNTINSLLNPMFTARLESDRFICLIEKKKISHDILAKACSVMHNYKGKKLRLRSKCGIYMIEQETKKVTDMIDWAKRATNYIVDEYVRPYVIFDESMSLGYVDRAEFASEFEEGIANKEFQVYYQPIMDANTEEIVSAEALIRWIHPEKGMIPPNHFIEALEKDGYISKLDEYVIDHVYDFLKKRKKKGLPIIPISINLSWMDFNNEEMIERIIEKLKCVELPESCVRYEITETSIAALKKNRSDILNEMQKNGAWVLLDDFGTGYSSLNMIMDYNFNIIKLDMSFIRKMNNNLKVRKLVSSIINMCHQQRIQVVVEGVETKEQLEILRVADCDYIQGYYFSKPLPEADFVSFVQEKLQ